MPIRKLKSVSIPRCLCAVTVAVTTCPPARTSNSMKANSLTFYPYTYHEYYIKEDSVPTLVGEVSMCNDDNIDNRFYEPVGRFPEIEEDEPAYRLLCNEYPAAKED
ncbi:D-lyxose/D-mannose family sugar isomerase [Bifidobacterium longum]|uniref:D-lyxose/D-mannose family sugar isomerase n=1 Tax=Bifidobacterium longum TaxID=216816 RepID=UPI002B4B9ED1|nr:D-lyxose/D-mannose family sugar isomerase [Bifidobacterium longum]